MSRQLLATSKRFSDGCTDGTGPACGRTILWWRTALLAARGIEPAVVLVTPAAQTGTAARPVALFVMGMARSGTSALTRVLSHAAIFPACRAVVHHGGAGTTAAGLRAGAPTLILSWTPEQAIWGAQLKRLEVGSGRRFSTTTEKSLVAELRRILAPQYVTRAREIATRMTKPAESVTTAADLLESFARLRRVR